MVSLEEYLRTSYEGLDREYVDGEILERALPNNLHSRTQWRIAGIFFALSKTHSLHGRTEMRSRVAETRVRIPDVSIFAGQEPSDPVPAQPPLIAIEITSPGDRLTETLEKLEEYRLWGVAHVWLVNPESRNLYVYTTGLVEVSSFQIPELSIEIPGAEIFG